MSTDSADDTVVYDDYPVSIFYRRYTLRDYELSNLRHELPEAFCIRRIRITLGNLADRIRSDGGYGYYYDYD